MRPRIDQTRLALTAAVASTMPGSCNDEKPSLSRFASTKLAGCPQDSVRTGESIHCGFQDLDTLGQFLPCLSNTGRLSRRISEFRMLLDAGKLVSHRRQAEATACTGESMRLPGQFLLTVGSFESDPASFGFRQERLQDSGEIVSPDLPGEILENLMIDQSGRIVRNGPVRLH